MQERLRADMARRDGLGRQARSALDGIVHALKPEGMDPHLPARHLLDYVLEGPDGPRAVVAAGDPATATHLTWLVSGMGIRPQTALWGTAREAAHLAAAQRAAGAPRPVVIGWLGYPAPTPWRVVLDGPGRRGGAMLAADVRAWWEFLRHGPGEDDDAAPATASRDRAEAATEKAIKSPLLDNLLLKNAKGLVVNVISGGDFSLDEQARITEKVRSLVDIDDANIFYGFVFNDELGEELQVTVVATGLTIDSTPKNERRFVPDANSNSKVEAGTHEAAYRDAPSYPQSPSQPNSHTSQVAYAPQPATPAPQPSPAPAQPEPAPRTGNGMRIQDYLRRQQGK